MKKIIQYIATLFLIFHFIIFLTQDRLFPNWFELPISNSNGLVVDNEDNIYVDCGSYRRIQVYNSSGKYLTSWKIPNFDGLYNLKYTDNKIIFNTYKIDSQFVFDTNGKEISRKKIDSVFYKTGGEFSSFIKGNSKFYFDGFIKKVKIKSNKNIITVINQNPIIQLLIVPYGFLFSMVVLLFSKYEG